MHVLIIKALTFNNSTHLILKCHKDTVQYFRKKEILHSSHTAIRIFYQNKKNYKGKEFALKKSKLNIEIKFSREITKLF